MNRISHIFVLRTCMLVFFTAACASQSARGEFLVLSFQITAGMEQVPTSALNDSGQVAGYSTATNRAAIWENGSVKDLTKTFGGTVSGIRSINNSSVSVGSAYTANNTSFRAAQWGSDGSIQDLGTLGGISSEAVDISDSGIIVGRSALQGDSIVRAVMWQSSGGIKELGNLGGTFSEARSVNNSGRAAGISFTNNNEAYRAAIWDTEGNITNLGTLAGGTLSDAFGVNDHGSVVGVSNSSVSGTRAFLWRDGGMMDLGTLGGAVGFARGINNSENIVGYSRTIQDQFQRATLWSGNQIIDLHALSGNLTNGASILDAFGISNADGSGKFYVHGFSTSGYYLMQIQDLSAVPEPTTVVAWVVGTGCLGLMRLKRRR